MHSGLVGSIVPLDM